jgi:hypothetical protein
MKRNFEVDIVRVSHKELTYVIFAEDEREAELLAYERAYSDDFTRGKDVYTDYEVNNCKEIGNVKRNS